MMKSSCLLSAVPLSKEGERRMFTGVAYSGGPVQQFHGQLVVDLDGIEFSEQLPVLVDHDPAKRLGVGTLQATDAELQIRGYLLRNELAASVAQDSDDGFPWQLSIRVDAGGIEDVQAGQEVSVNGRSFSGPLMVFRRNRVSEVSFVPLGADASTYARVFSRDSDEDRIMPDAKNEALAEQVAALTEQVTALTADRDAAMARAEKAEAALKDLALAKRKGEAEALLKAMGEEVTEEAVKPYLEMSDDTFQAVERQTRALLSRSPGLPGALFSREAPGAPEPVNPLLADAKRRAGK